MVRKARRSAALVVSLALAALLWAPPAAARSQRDLPWGADHAWTATIRLLRLDLGFSVTERDRDAGFILFQYVDGEHRSSGSVEVVERTLADGRVGVRVVVSLPAQPSYVELHLLDRLERKLREEVGERSAPPAPRRASPAEASDEAEPTEGDAPEPAPEERR